MLTEAYPADEMDHLTKELVPYLTLTQYLSLGLIYVACIIIAVMVIVHVTEVTVFHYLRSLNQFAALKNLPQQALLAGGRLQQVGGHVPVALPQTEESDYDSDDCAMTTNTWAYEGRRAIHQQPRAITTRTLPHRREPPGQPHHLMTGSMTLSRASPNTDIKFAETKV